MREIFGLVIKITKIKMNSQEQEVWKEKINKLKRKIEGLNRDKDILVNLLDKSKFNLDAPSENPPYALELEEKISQKNDWIEFYSRKIEKYESRLRQSSHVSEKDPNKKAEDEEVKKDDIKNLFNLVFSETQEKLKITDAVSIQRPRRKKLPEAIGNSIGKLTSKIKRQALIFNSGKPVFIYAAAFAIVLIIIAGLFFIKPNISGYAVFGKEATYNSNLSLKISQSGNYTWTAGRAGDIKSITASGSLNGNGTARVYIEKNGKRYLIFDSKRLNNPGNMS